MGADDFSNDPFLDQGFQPDANVLDAAAAALLGKPHGDDTHAGSYSGQVAAQARSIAEHLAKNLGAATANAAGVGPMFVDPPTPPPHDPASTTLGVGGETIFGPPAEADDPSMAPTPAPAQPDFGPRHVPEGDVDALSLPHSDQPFGVPDHDLVQPLSAPAQPDFRAPIGSTEYSGSPADVAGSIIEDLVFIEPHQIDDDPSGVTRDSIIVDEFPTPASGAVDASINDANSAASGHIDESVDIIDMYGGVTADSVEAVPFDSMDLINDLGPGSQIGLSTLDSVYPGSPADWPIDDVISQVGSDAPPYVSDDSGYITPEPDLLGDTPPCDGM